MFLDFEYNTMALHEEHQLPKAIKNEAIKNSYIQFLNDLSLLLKVKITIK